MREAIAHLHAQLKSHHPIKFEVSTQILLDDCCYIPINDTILFLFCSHTSLSMIKIEKRERERKRERREYTVHM